jgi:putative NADPH-quinone reductase
MHVRLVHAHPEPRSFGAAMRDTMRSAFESRGDLVTISDLYAMRFNPVASSADFDRPVSSDLRCGDPFHVELSKCEILASICELIGSTFPPTLVAAKP